MTIRLMLLTATALTLTACDNRNDAAANTAPEAIATATADADDKAIRLQVAKWLDLVKAKDAAGIAQLYAEDGAVMPPNAPIGKGRGAVEKTWAGMMDTPGFDLNFTPEQIVLSASGDMALDRGTYRLSMRPGGEPVSDTGKYVVVWRKVGGEWKAAADIFSSDLPAAGG